MKVQKTWSTIEFHCGKAYIEATLNYETKKFYLSHGNNDQNVTFSDESITTCLERAKCVVEALKYINQQLFK